MQQCYQINKSVSILRHILLIYQMVFISDYHVAFQIQLFMHFSYMYIEVNCFREGLIGLAFYVASYWRISTQNLDRFRFSRIFLEFQFLICMMVHISSWKTHNLYLHYIVMNNHLSYVNNYQRALSKVILYIYWLYVYNFCNGIINGLLLREFTHLNMPNALSFPYFFMTYMCIVICTELQFSSRLNLFEHLVIDMEKCTSDCIKDKLFISRLIIEIENLLAVQ